MPAVIGATVLSWVGASAAFSSTVIVGSITVAHVVGTAIIIGANLAVASAFAPSAQRAGAQQFTTRQPIPPRRRYYGKNKAAGYAAFIQSLNGDLYQVVLIAAHEVAFLEHWIGDRVVTLDGGGNVTLPATMVDDSTPRFLIAAAAGTEAQVAHALLATKFPILWTADHRLRGITNVMFLQQGVEAKKFSRFYPGGPQQYRSVFNGDRVYDVTDVAQNATTPAGWALGHDNAANVIRDYLVSTKGMRLPLTAVSPAFADWVVAANTCNELVILKDATTDKRYRIAGGYDLDAAPKEQLVKYLSACDGFIYMRGDGALSLNVGKWEAPTFTLDESHIRSFNLPKGLGPLRQANEIRATFVDPNQDYQPVEAEPWRDESDISARGAVLSKAFDLTYVPTHNQTRRLMKIASAHANPPRVGTLTTDLYGLNAIGQRRIHVNIPRRNINLDMEVTSFRIDMTSQSVIFGVLAVTSAAYDFDAATEEGTQASPAAASSNNSIETPANLVVATGVRDYGNGVTAAYLEASVDPPVRTDLTFHAELRTHNAAIADANATWLVMNVATGAYAALSNALAVGNYDVRVWFAGPMGSVGDYVYERDFAVANESNYFVTAAGVPLVTAGGAFIGY